MQEPTYSITSKCFITLDASIVKQIIYPPLAYEKLSKWDRLRANLKRIELYDLDEIVKSGIWDAMLFHFMRTFGIQTVLLGLSKHERRKFIKQLRPYRLSFIDSEDIKQKVQLELDKLNRCV